MCARVYARARASVKKKVGGLGPAPLAFEEFTRWCSQRVVLLQRRSKVAFPTLWGVPKTFLKGFFKEI